MKKLLNILGLISITASAGASVAACTSNDEGQEDTLEQIQLRQNFVAEISTTIRNHFASPVVTTRLIQTSTTFENNDFFKYYTNGKINFWFWSKY